ncbi:MAG TPA: MoxR family ATPase [Thermoplasmataceae archaeon]|nr:MoxR family ATPase [Thermoplasmataceae archaeon]
MGLGEVSLESVSTGLLKQGYIPSPQIVTSVYLAMRLGRPLLVEGDPGCGKTELAKAISGMLGASLIRLQCYDGLDVSSALYDWNYMKQIMEIRIRQARSDLSNLEEDIFSEKFLMKRPLLQALLRKGDTPTVLLIDEIDRTDEEFEGFLLEFLGEFQVTVPEVGTFRAEKPPIVILTSNRTRELGDGLRRRCLYLYLTYPDRDREMEIVRTKLPRVGNELVADVVKAVSSLRSSNAITKRPGISESIAWAEALDSLGKHSLDYPSAVETLSCVLKTPEDLEEARKIMDEHFK